MIIDKKNLATIPESILDIFNRVVKTGELHYDGNDKTNKYVLQEIYNICPSILNNNVFICNLFILRSMQFSKAVSYIYPYYGYKKKTNVMLFEKINPFVCSILSSDFESANWLISIHPEYLNDDSTQILCKWSSKPINGFERNDDFILFNVASFSEIKDNTKRYMNSLNQAC